METMEMHPIAHMRSDFPTKFGIPRQSGLVEELRSMIVFEPEYRSEDALRGIEDFSHLWLIWQFSQAVREGWSPTVRPPRLGGNTRMGVFATRSPFRPNNLGLSCVRLLEVKHTQQYGTVLIVGGADLLDCTPIFDIKPYLAYTDSHPEASGSFALAGDAVRVECAEGVLDALPQEKRETLLRVLAQDPRPGYQHEAGRVYGFPFGGFEVRFTVADGVLTVLSAEKV